MAWKTDTNIFQYLAPLTTHLNVHQMQESVWGHMKDLNGDSTTVSTNTLSTSDSAIIDTSVTLWAALHEMSTVTTAVTGEELSWGKFEAAARTMVCLRGVHASLQTSISNQGRFIDKTQRQGASLCSLRRTSDRLLLELFNVHSAIVTPIKLFHILFSNQTVDPQGVISKGCCAFNWESISPSGPVLSVKCGRV